MKYIRKEILRLFDLKNSKRRERLNSFVSDVQRKLRKVKLKNPIRLEIVPNVTSRTKSEGYFNSWGPIRAHCRGLNIFYIDAFHFPTNERMSVEIVVKGIEDFCAIASAIEQYRSAGYSPENNCLWIGRNDILIVFWYHVE
ncbi:hypothetical protein KAJ89_02605 [Candidatus Parcubacteria bacterium]|nr:hypothetical protein [Candidatus Parcubacteria bacterium]